MNSCKKLPNFEPNSNGGRREGMIWNVGRKKRLHRQGAQNENFR